MFDPLAEARAEVERERKVAHSKAVLRKMQRVAVWTFEGVAAVEQASRLEASVELVTFWQRVLGWGRSKRLPGPRRIEFNPFDDDRRASL